MTTANREAVRKIGLVVEYDGSNYRGFQWQPAAPTVQGELESAILKTTGERVRVLAASRTDTGVHAKGQVVSFRTGSRLSPETFARALNHYLPKDIVIQKTFEAPAGFNVQRDALSREYRYYILDSTEGAALWRNYSCPLPGKLNIAAMNRACSLLVGEHDFVSFTSKLGKQPRNTVRRVYEAGVRKRRPVIMFYITANSFLPHQIRRTVSALIGVGLGRMPLEDFGRLLESKQRGIISDTAPAQGLYLVRVNYAGQPGENA
ncbi:MAG: tRNA pseudouridine(38-40) synthase TruA [Chloroflexi bacterium]|nr:tRNA pseudouridine(38-40) synthase TruA [Chloroflexota bacterium]